VPRRLVSLALVVAAVAPPADAAALARALAPPAGWLVPPVDAAVARPYDEPAGAFGAGHRGLDYAVPSGTLVRAAAAGRVTFAGPVAGVRAVSIDHGDGLTTTYTSLTSASVAATDVVQQGQWIGRAGVSHVGGAPGVHFGVKVDGDYVDPALYLGPVDLTGAVHLAPLASPSPPVPTSSLGAALDALERRSGCRPPERVDDPPPPSGNVAVGVAGLGSSTAGAGAPAIYERAPDLLGYPRASVYRFSYAGSRGPDLHEPYARTDTHGDLREAAARLRALLMRIARRAPGRHVDLLAHSQGGLVARIYLESLHDAWDPRLPVIDHLVTFATPHEGAPLAATARALAEDTASGALLLRWLSSKARSGAPWPDPLSPAVAQLAPGSALVRALATEDVAYGTRVLALGAANDAVVPADRAELAHELSRVIGPVGVTGHSAIVEAHESIATAYAFLRDAAEPCRTGWDVWGPRIGRVAGWLEERVPWLYARAERAVTGPVLVRGLAALLPRKG
jgi:hypothetical protein